MTTTYLGIDVGGTHIRAMAETAGVRTSMSQEKVATGFDELVQQLADKVAHHKATTTVVTLPGRVWNNQPVWIPNLPFLDGRDFVAEICARVNTDVTVINDAQAALIAESHDGSAKGCRNAALVAIGTGIGGALLLDGKLFSGHTGTAGSFGWLGARVEDATDVLGPGNSGPWECAAAGTSLLEITSRWPNIDEFLRDFDNDQPEAVSAAQEYARRLAGGFASIASTFDPEKIIVVGGVSTVINRILPSVTRQMQAFTSPTGREVDIVVGTLGARAGTVGALFRAQGETA